MALAMTTPVDAFNGSQDDVRGVSVEVTGLINAPVEQVWALLIDPRRRREWEPVPLAQVEVHPDGAFTTTASVRRSDGSRVRVRSNRRRILHTPMELVTPSQISWSMTLPDKPSQTRVWRLSVALEAAGAGTRVRLREEVEHSRRIGPLRRNLLRFFIGQGLRQRAAAIDRVLR